VHPSHRPFPDAVAEKSAARERDAPALDERQEAAVVRLLNLWAALPLVGSELCTPDADRSAEQSFWEAVLAAELAAAPPRLPPEVGRKPSVVLEAQLSRSADLPAAGVTRQEAWPRPAQAHWAGPWAGAR
jgi:hypothetical protein